MAASLPLMGGCFCGQIRYQITAPLASARMCHCSKCRKVFSGTGSAYAEVQPGSFTWTRGSEKLKEYSSVPDWALGFCGTCGSSLCGLHKGEVHGVTLGSVE
ncbi:MAG: GFA family protein, partial [Rhodospirillaceae bacterium]